MGPQHRAAALARAPETPRRRIESRPIQPSSPAAKSGFVNISTGAAAKARSRIEANMETSERFRHSTFWRRAWKNGLRTRMLLAGIDSRLAAYKEAPAKSPAGIGIPSGLGRLIGFRMGSGGGEAPAGIGIPAYIWTLCFVKELVFIVEKDPEEGYLAHSLGESIFTQADDMAALQVAIRDAIPCHFPDPEDRPDLIRLRHIWEDVFIL
jgi:hypothetical protein